MSGRRPGGSSLGLARAWRRCAPQLLQRRRPAPASQTSIPRFVYLRTRPRENSQFQRKRNPLRKLRFQTKADPAHNLKSPTSQWFLTFSLEIPHPGLKIGFLSLFILTPRLSSVTLLSGGYFTLYVSVPGSRGSDSSVSVALRAAGNLTSQAGLSARWARRGSPHPPAETSQKTPPAVDWKMSSPKSR